MSQFAITEGGSIASFEKGADSASRLSIAFGSISSPQAINTYGNGISVVSDRVSIASSARFTAEQAALAAMTAAATRSVSMLQITESNLSAISGILSEMDALAASAMASDLSSSERARLDNEFQRLMAQINSIAAQAQFDGIKLLQGDGAGGALEMDIRVGSGVSSADEITISIGAASVADLDTELATDGVQTAAGATTARANIIEAETTLAGIQGRVAGDRARITTAIEIAGLMAARSEDARRELTTPEAAIDLAALVAGKSARDSGIDAFKGAGELLRGLVLDLNIADGGDRVDNTDNNDQNNRPVPVVANGSGSSSGSGESAAPE